MIEKDRTIHIKDNPGTSKNIGKVSPLAISTPKNRNLNDLYNNLRTI